MTDIEKAKAYDMAIKKAIELLNSPRTCFDMKLLESIFPQLVENEEDETVTMSPYEVEFCQKFCGHTPDYYTSKGWKIIKNYYAEFKKIVMRELEEQKPLVLSDKDIEKMVEKRSRASGTTASEMAFYRRGIEDTLKFLRSHWKPSKEQMRSLKFFLNLHHSQAVCATTEWKEYSGLKSLYTDLQTKFTTI